MIEPPNLSSRLMLASTSRYRRDLLARLGLPFDVSAPHVDETPHPGEAPAPMTERLAMEKAMAVALRHPDQVVIGSDQTAELDGQAIGKPGTHARAVAQLRVLSGRSVLFHTAVAVVQRSRAQVAAARVEVRVQFRSLSEDEIEAYLLSERPYDCAGSAKSEGLGIVLLDAIVSDDPTALIGLPLITTARLLRELGVDPLRRAPLAAP